MTSKEMWRRLSGRTPSPIRVVGEIAFVKLMNSGAECMIDKSDIGLVDGKRWVEKRRHPYTSYAECKCDEQVYMHQLIMKAPAGFEVDHRHGNGLDNRRSELRVCTHTQNLRNGSKVIAGTSAYRGVYFEKWTGKWMARLRHGGRTLFYRRCATEEEAARAYDEAALRHHGEFARLNFPGGTL